MTSNQKQHRQPQKRWRSLVKTGRGCPSLDLCGDVSNSLFGAFFLLFFFPDSTTKLGDKLQREKKETRVDSLHFPLVKCVDETPILSEL